MILRLVSLFLGVLITLLILLTTTLIAEGEGQSIIELSREIQSNESVFYPEDAPPATHKAPPKGEIEAYIRKVFAEDPETAVKVAKCESGLNPRAINWGDANITGMPSHGIFQLNEPYNEELFNWKYNIDRAYLNYYAKRKWQPWSCFRKI